MTAISGRWDTTISCRRFSWTEYKGVKGVSRGRFGVKGTVLLTTFGTKVVSRTVPLTPP